MTRRWKPPRWAKPMKREQRKDEACEEIIRSLQGMNRKTTDDENVDTTKKTNKEN